LKFLDKKERVIDMQLTPYGKYLLSNGNLKPEYYAFFDDDVIYDKRYAGGTADHTNEEEPQNDIQDRIKEDVQLSAQTVFTSREESSKQNYNFGRQVHAGYTRFGLTPGGNSFSTEDFVPPNLIPETTEFFDSSYAIGTSNLGQRYKSAWNVGTLKGRMTGSLSYFSSSAGRIKDIPQIEMAPITYKSVVSNDSGTGFNTNDSFSTLEFEDGKYIRVFEDSILLNVVEENVEDSLENYEIELFEIKSIYKPGVIPLVHVTQSIPLNFVKKKEEIKNNILLDTPETSVVVSDLDSTCVDYYFEVLVDDEINQGMLCDLSPTDKKLGVFSSRGNACDDLEKQEKISSENLYTSDVTLDNIEEEC